MIDYKQSQYLIGLKKKILKDGNIQHSIHLDYQCPMRIRYELVSEENDEFSFLLQIAQSSKNTVRISLHCQDSDSKVGLIRLDYNAGHINPSVATDDVPPVFLPYIGKIFSDSEHHVHIHVNGYKSLAWAIPVKEMTGAALEMRRESFADDFDVAVKEFLRIINVETKILINRPLL